MEREEALLGDPPSFVTTRHRRGASVRDILDSPHEKVIDKLNLEQIGFSDFTLVNGEQKRTNIYKAEIDFFNKTINVDVLSTNADFSLAGMELCQEA